MTFISDSLNRIKPSATMVITAKATQLKREGKKVMSESISAGVLGVVQGLTEFLPVSSSGHLVVFQKFLPVQGDHIAFDLVLHLGTLLPIFWVYRNDIGSILKGVLSNPKGEEARLGLWIVLGSIRVGCFGLRTSGLI